MMTRKHGIWCIGIVGVALILAACASQLTHHTNAAIRVGDSDLGGVVSSSSGPEAGV